MAYSFAQEANLICSECGETFTGQIWLIVDVVERPDLLDKVRLGTLHAIPCPHCGCQGAVNAPLLVYHSRQDLPLVFSPAQDTIAAQDQQHVAWLVSLLRERVGVVWQDGWVARGIPSMQRAMLPIALSDDPRETLRQMVKRAQQNVVSARQELDGLAPEERARIIVEKALAGVPIAVVAEDLDDVLFQVLSEVSTTAEAGSERARRLEYLEVQLHQLRAQIRKRAKAQQFVEEVWIQSPEIGDEFLEKATQQDMESFYRNFEKMQQWAQELVKRDPEAYRKICQQTTQVMERLQQENPEAYQRMYEKYQQAVKKLLQQDPGASLDMIGRGIDDLWLRDPKLYEELEEQFPRMLLVAPLLRILQKSVLPDTLIEIGRVVNRYFDEKGEGIDTLLNPCIAVAQARGDTVAKQILEEYRDLLRCCLEEFSEAELNLIAMRPRLSQPVRDQLASQLVRIGSVKEYEHLLAEQSDLRAMLSAMMAGMTDNRMSTPAEFREILVEAEEAEQRYQDSRDPTNLDEAVAARNEILNHPMFASAPLLFQIGMLHDAGTAYLELYRETSQLIDLDRSINLLRGAVTRTPADSLMLPSSLCSLSIGLRSRFALTDDATDLSEAIRMAEKAVKQSPAGSPNLPRCLDTLGQGLRDRYTCLNNLEDLKKALKESRSAVEHIPPHSPHLPSLLGNLGVYLIDLYEHTPEQTYLDEAVQVFEKACQTGLDLAPNKVLGVARNWGLWATKRESWREAVRAYGYGIEAMEQLYRSQLLRKAKESWLAKGQGLYTRAAYALARSGDCPSAVVMLEKGRTRLLSEVLDRSQADLKRVQDQEPESYADYQKAVDTVRKLEATERMEGTSSWRSSRMDLRMAIRLARGTLNKTLKRIQDIEGFQDFLSVPDLDDIIAVVRPNTPLVYLVVASVDSLALVVHSTGKVTSHRVSGLSTDELFRKISGYTLEESLRKAKYGYIPGGELGGYLGAYGQWMKNPLDQSAHAVWLDALDETTHWLWDVLMGPLVEILCEQGYTQAMLIPCGMEALLPLHAAWHHGQDNARQYALDQIALGYVPSARALAHAQQVAAVVSGERLFAVDDPSGHLDHSTQEVQAVAQCFSESGSKPRIVSRDRATLETVLAALPQYDVYHFSCHGNNAWKEPLKSMLWMYGNKPFTVSDLLSLEGKLRSRLAFLSACETGLIGSGLPGEAIGWASGFLQAGAAGTVSTLWSVADESTAVLVEHFYENWKRQSMDPLQALVEAQKWLRDKANDGHWWHPYYWAGFTLTGI